MNREDIPEIIKKVGFDFDWDEKKVWSLKMPVSKINIKKLIWHFDIPFHWNRPGIYNLTSNEILANPKKYFKEYERAMKSDLSYPIEIMKNKGKWLILDGLHRLMKAQVLGLKDINVRKIPRSKIKDIVKE